MRLIGYLALLFVGLYLAGMLWLWLFQRKILFHPTHEKRPHEGFYLDLPVGKVWVEVRHPGRKKALLYFPGNSEHWWENPDTLSRMLPAHTLYFLHYPGYGASEGSPSQEALCQAALALYDAVDSRHEAVDVIGRSLGSGVALHVAAQRPVHRLVLITPYDSIAALGQERYPLYPIRWLSKDPFDAVREAPRLQAPVLVLLAEDDRVISPRHSRRLIHALNKTKKRIETLPDTTHTDIIDSPQFGRILHEFLEGSSDKKGE
jgi:pimeloyl-ACP methyl ester carboxylesterase